MGRRCGAGVVLAGIALLSGGRIAVSSLHAQTPAPLVKPATPLMAIAHRDLTFGTVLPGVPTSVPSLHPRFSGLFEVRGHAGSSIRVEFLLPGALVSGAGSLLPVAFGPGDGFADFSRGRPPRGVVFDPGMPLLGDLGPNGRLFLHLGGTVLPSPTQAGGEYVATISITVFDLGI